LQSETFQVDVRDATEVLLPGFGPDLLAWRDEDDRLMVVNFGSAPAHLRAFAGLPHDAELVASTDSARLPGAVTLGRFVLLPREAVLLRLAAR
jgi:hypothetical protein